MQSKKITITICMGSSCFSRGNSLNAEIIQDYIARNSLDVEFDVRGCLCQGNCKSGPNITINGKLFSNVSPEGIIDLINHEIGTE